MTLLVLLHAALTLSWLGAYTFLLAKARHVLEKPRIPHDRHHLDLIRTEGHRPCGVDGAVHERHAGPRAACSAPGPHQR